MLSKTSSKTALTRGLVAGIFVALIAILIWQGLTALNDNSAENRRRAAVDAARAQVLDLTTMSTKDVTQRLDSMQRRTDGNFKAQLAQIATTFASTVKKNNIDAKGVIDAIAVQSISKTQAQVLVASTSTVTAAKTSPVKQSYRFGVSLHWRGHKWLIDGMEFVG